MFPMKAKLSQEIWVKFKAIVATSTVPWQINARRLFAIIVMRLDITALSATRDLKTETIVFSVRLIMKVFHLHKYLCAHLSNPTNNAFTLEVVQQQQMIQEAFSVLASQLSIPNLKYGILILVRLTIWHSPKWNLQNLQTYHGNSKVHNWWRKSLHWICW